MDILGFNITKKKFAQPATVSSSINNTKPSVPLKQAFPKQEMGDTGISGLRGIITEEYNGSLQGTAGIKVYDEMRKSDGTVRSAMLVTTLPIRRATWMIKGCGETPQDEEIKDFVEKALFEWMEGTWDDLIRQALLMIPFGVMPFEKVYGTREYEGKSYVTLKKLAPRLPKSIQQWELADGTFGIQQIRQDGQIANIPGSKLVIFVNEKEGDNWWGTSMLRAAYKHWYFKNNFYKIDAIAFERQGLGIPMIKMPTGYTQSDENKAKQALQNLRANENAYMIIPTGYEAEFMNMGSNTTRDPSNSIQHHNREIVKAVLAQFLELGATNTGSKALSTDHTELFLKSIEAVADTIVAEVNKLIRELVDLNYNDVEDYPKLNYTGIAKVDVEKLANAFGTLVTAGAVTPTENDEQYLRAVLGLPEMTEEDAAHEAKETPEEESVEDAADMEQETPEAGEVEKAVTKKDKNVAHEHDTKERIFSDGKGFTGWRPLTFAEEKVSWKNIEDQINKLETDFAKEAKALLNSKKDDFMAKLHVAIEAGDTIAIRELEAKFITDYKVLIKDYMKKAYEYGKNNVSTEMGVQVPPNTAASLANIDLMADTAAGKMAADIEAKAKLESANHLKNGTPVLQAVGSIDLVLEELITKNVETTAGIIVAQSLNTGRSDVFQRNIGMIHALQRSEVLDTKTCNFCLSMDGRYIAPDDIWAKTDVYHTHCRGIWVEVLKDEQGVENIVPTKIPTEISDLYGGTPNSLIQPKNAKVEDNSPAKAEVEKRKKK